MQAMTSRVLETNSDPQEVHVSTAASGIFEHFNLNDEIDRFPPESTTAGRRAETLIKSDRLRVVLVTMKAGVGLIEHAAPGPITIQVLRGRFVVAGTEQERELGAGGLIALGAYDRHSVHALDTGAFLLTISWPPRMAGDPIF